MLELFLVDADPGQRSALRWAINWDQLGFSVAGEAEDGEMALSMIRRQPPDLLITELNLSYLSGLDLCRRVRQEYPNTRILICTRSRELRDLQCAVEIGVDGYIFKDAQPEELRAAAERMRERIERQRQRNAEQALVCRRTESFTQYQRRSFFDLLVAQGAPINEVYDQAQALGIDLRSDEYCFLLLMMRPNYHDGLSLERMGRILGDMTLAFTNAPQFECFSFHQTLTAILIMADAGRMDAQLSFCMRNIRRSLLPLGESCRWVAACSNPVNRLSALSACFTQAQEVLAYAAMMPDHLLMTPSSVTALHSADLEQQLRKLGPPIPLSEELDRYLKTGTPEEAQNFAQRVLDGMSAEAIQVPELCRYIMLRIRLCTMAYVLHVLHLEAESLLSAVEGMPPIDRIFGREGTLRYLRALLARATQLRDASLWSRYHPSIRQGLHFIDQHFTRSDLSLGQVAEAAGLSPNYFSSLFRREVGCTFGEYLTEKRISRARELLRSTALRASQVARDVGYQDAHYFSNLFRRTQGCTPREYRLRVTENRPRRRAAQAAQAAQAAPGGNPPAGQAAPGGNLPAGQAAPGGNPPAGQAAPGGNPPAAQAAPGGNPPAGQAAPGGNPPAGLSRDEGEK